MLQALTGEMETSDAQKHICMVASMTGEWLLGDTTEQAFTGEYSNLKSLNALTIQTHPRGPLGATRTQPYIAVALHTSIVVTM